jgi:hypothetical protein
MGQCADRRRAVPVRSVRERAMTYTFLEEIHIDGTSYQLLQYPLEDYLALLPARPKLPKRPWNTNGYMATWSVEGGILYLAELSAPIDDLVTQLFPDAQGPVRANWFNGILVGCRGNRRHVGYPTRRIFDDEIYLEIRAGTVTRQWLMDLRAVPDQTDDELRLSLPRFLWPARLRDGTNENDDKGAT